MRRAKSLNTLTFRVRAANDQAGRLLGSARHIYDDVITNAQRNREEESVTHKVLKSTFLSSHTRSQGSVFAKLLNLNPIVMTKHNKYVHVLIS